MRLHWQLYPQKFVHNEKCSVPAINWPYHRIGWASFFCEKYENVTSWKYKSKCQCKNCMILIFLVAATLKRGLCDQSDSNPFHVKIEFKRRIYLWNIPMKKRSSKCLRLTNKKCQAFFWKGSIFRILTKDNLNSFQLISPLSCKS